MLRYVGTQRGIKQNKLVCGIKVANTYEECKLQ